MTDSNTNATTIQADAEGEISLLDLLQVVVGNLRLLVLGPLLVGLLALGISFLITPTYTATTRFLVPQGQSASAAMLQSLGALSGLAGAAGLKSPGDQFVSFIKSDSVQNALVDRFGLMERYEEKFRVDTRKELAKVTSIVSNAKDGIVTIEASDKDAIFAANLANGHVQELQRLLGRLAVTEAQQRRQFFEKLIATTKANWVRAEQELKATGVNSSSLKLNPASALEGVAKIHAAVTAQEIKLSSMRGYLSDAAPEFKQAQTELSALKQQLTLLERQDSESGTGPNASQNDYIAKYREYKYNETLFELFSKQYEIARIDEGREGATIQIIDVAEPPEHKSKPKKAMIALIAALASGGFLLLFVFVRNALRGAVVNPQAAEKLMQLQRSWRRAIGRH
jgi:capsule polysaccharide export protein KpsE/RkpR